MDQRLYVVKEVFEVAANQVERWGVSPVGAYRIESVEVEKRMVPMRVRVPCPQERHWAVEKVVWRLGKEVCMCWLASTSSWAEQRRRECLIALCVGAICNDVLGRIEVLDRARVVVRVALELFQLGHLQITCSLFFEVAKRERCELEQVFEHRLLRGIFFLHFNQIIDTDKLDVLELGEVCDVEKGSPVHPDLRLWVTALEVDAVSVKVCFGPPFLEIFVPSVFKFAVQSPDVVLLIIVKHLMITSAKGKVSHVILAQRWEYG